MTGIALITGGGSGIGRALARALLADGWTVVVLGRRLAPLAATVAGHPSGHALPCDVTDREALFTAVAAVERDHGPIALFIANAGAGLAGEVLDLTPDDWTRMRAVNYDAVVYGIEAVYPRMAARKRGQIVNVSSAAGLLPRPGMAPYAAAKHAVVGLTLSLRPEAARHGVGVTLVCPGPVDTDIVASSPARGLNAEGLRSFASGKGMSAEQAAERILAAARSNRALLTLTAVARLEWRLFRLSTRLGLLAARLRLAALRRVGR